MRTNFAIQESKNIKVQQIKIKNFRCQIQEGKLKRDYK